MMVCYSDALQTPREVENDSPLIKSTSQQIAAANLIDHGDHAYKLTFDCLVAHNKSICSPMAKKGHQEER